MHIDPSDDRTTRRWHNEFASILKSFFHEQRDAAAARVTAVTTGAEKIGDNADPIVQAALAFDWTDLINAAEDPLFEAVRAGMSRGLARAGVVDPPDLATDDLARGYALVRAVEMAGMKCVDGELVQNPEAKFAISHTIRNQLSRLVTRALREKTPLIELGEKIRQSAAFSDANAETIAGMEIRRAENWGVSVALSTGQTEMTPGKGRELSVLLNVPEAHRLAVEAAYEIMACDGPRMAEALGSLEEIVADLAKRSSLPGPKTLAAVNGALTLLLEALPACYALMDVQRNDRFIIVDRWRQEVLHLPTHPARIASRIIVSSNGGESHQRLIDPQEFTPALAEILWERNWVKAMEAIPAEVTQGTTQSGVNAYICGAAMKLLEYQRINEDKEYVNAAANGQQLVSSAEIVRSGEEVQFIGIEEVADDITAMANVVDYTMMPGPAPLRTAFQMLHDGYHVADAARAIGTDSKHFRQTILRIVNQLEPGQADALEDWINYRQFHSAPYAMELLSIVAKLNSARITKLAVAQVPRPDPTRARSTGRLGTDEQIWMK